MQLMRPLMVPGPSERARSPSNVSESSFQSFAAAPAGASAARAHRTMHAIRAATIATIATVDITARATPEPAAANRKNRNELVERMTGDLVQEGENRTARSPGLEGPRRMT